MISSVLAATPFSCCPVLWKTVRSRLVYCSRPKIKQTCFFFLPFQTVIRENDHPLRAAVKNWDISRDESCVLQLRLAIWRRTVYRKRRKRKLDPAWNPSCSLHTWWKPFPQKFILMPQKIFLKMRGRYVAVAQNYSQTATASCKIRVFFFPFYSLLGWIFVTYKDMKKKRKWCLWLHKISEMSRTCLHY